MIEEALGEFYIGDEYDVVRGEATGRRVTYDAKDLTTHGLIVGMTGSGKTGLGISILEEAALDGVPVLALDPKGDIGNLLLTFPDFRPEDFEPWVDPAAAQREGLSLREYAASQAELWKTGLARSGQGPERMRRLRAAADFTLFTPGSRAGVPLNILGSFAAPSEAERADADRMAERIEATATSLLTLLDVDADPMTSSEHVFLGHVLQHAWSAGRDLTLEQLVEAVMRPPFDRIGVMDLDTVFGPKDRTALAMRMNNVLASPSFAAWLEGEPLDVQRLLYTPEGKPRVSVVSVAHLGEAERMFFVSLLLEQVVGWVRQQSGTTSLRALLYIDELMGYMPPVANPPSKTPLLTLLKQARAYGLGVLLSTQNPVDLDYKGVSNTGTWFVGRLQTEQDKARLLDGLTRAAPDAGADGTDLDALISSLGKRQFYLHNVHESAPVTLRTRWVMSYLAGPLSREKIERLTPERPAPATDASGIRAADGGDAGRRPAIGTEVAEFFVPSTEPEGVIYFPHLLALADVSYADRSAGVHAASTVTRLLEPAPSPAPIAWSAAEAVQLDPQRLEASPVAGASFRELGFDVGRDALEDAETLFERHLQDAAALALHRHDATGLTQGVDEPLDAFLARVGLAMRETRDAAKEAIRKRYASKLKTLENRLLRAEQQLEVQKEQAAGKRVNAALSIGTELIGSFLGRRSVTSTKVSRAMRSLSTARKESSDVGRAEEVLERVQAEMAEMQAELDAELEAAAAAQPSLEDLDRIEVRPSRSGIHTHFVALAWVPFREGRGGRLERCADL